MGFKMAMDLATLQREQRKKLCIDGQHILFLWHQEQVHAIQAQCPHLKLPLTKGTLTEQGSIICPFHKSEFNLKTGATECWSPWPPVVGNLLGKVSKEKPLKIYATKIEEGNILVDVG